MCGKKDIKFRAEQRGQGEYPYRVDKQNVSKTPEEEQNGIGLKQSMTVFVLVADDILAVFIIPACKCFRGSCPTPGPSALHHLLVGCSSWQVASQFNCLEMKLGDRLACRTPFLHCSILERSYMCIY